jgi:hypothetical protein
MPEAVRALLKAGAKTDVHAVGEATALDLATYATCEENAKMIQTKASGRWDPNPQPPA